ncbi:MAG: hypothetical protein Q4C37_10895 [Bacteroidales bacterium]|nr:hypothetical protein [Bacteroidales bacterium]
MKEPNILEKAGGKTGYTVPPGYFDNVRSKILDNLPEYPVVVQEKLSVWKRVQPYIYMAAMFAGIWCMMKIFHTISSTDLNFDNPPEAVAVAIANTDQYNNFRYGRDDNTQAFMIEEELSDGYVSIEDFKEDFRNTDI